MAAMELIQYLHRNRVRRYQFAERIGLTRAGIAHLMTRNWTSRETMERIIVETDGKVTPNDFFDIPALLESHKSKADTEPEAA